MRDIGSPLGSTMLEVVNECRVDNADTFWTGAFCPDAISRPVQIPCFDIAASPGNRINGYARFTRDGRGVAALLRFGRQVLSPLFLIQQRMHALVFEDGSHTLEGTLSERICQVINGCSLNITAKRRAPLIQPGARSACSPAVSPLVVSFPAVRSSAV